MTFEDSGGENQIESALKNTFAGKFTQLQRELCFEENSCVEHNVGGRKISPNAL